MRPRIVWPLLVAILLLGVAMSCDKQPAAAPQEEAKVPPPPPPPTTRELMDGPRADLETKVAPLKLKVPAGWKLEVLGSVAMAEGPAPAGNEQIMVSTLPGMDEKRIDLWISGAKADSDRNPQRLQVHELANVNGMRVLEKITYSRPTTRPLLTTNPSMAAMPSTQISPDDQGMVNYTRFVFVPFEGSFIPCSFGITGMTEDEYSRDEEFVQSLMNTAQRSSNPEFQ